MPLCDRGRGGGTCRCQPLGLDQRVPPRPSVLDTARRFNENARFYLHDDPGPLRALGITDDRTRPSLRLTLVPKPNAALYRCKDYGELSVSLDFEARLSVAVADRRPFSMPVRVGLLDEHYLAFDSQHESNSPLRIVVRGVEQDGVFSLRATLFLEPSAPFDSGVDFSSLRPDAPRVSAVHALVKEHLGFRPQELIERIVFPALLCRSSWREPYEEIPGPVRMTVASYREATPAERDDKDRATLVLQAAAGLERLTFAVTIGLGATERPWQLHGEFQPGTLEPGTGREIVAQGRTLVKPPLSGILQRRFACSHDERLHADLELRMIVGPQRVPSAKLSLSWSGDCRGENLHCAANWSGAAE